jgi:hypothetical protein
MCDRCKRAGAVRILEGVKMATQLRDCAEDPKISSNGQVTYILSGQIGEENIAELEALIRSEAKGRRMVFDLKNVTLVGQDAIAFLDGCEANGITLKNCPAYIRQWIK